MMEQLNLLDQQKANRIHFNTTCDSGIMMDLHPAEKTNCWDTLLSTPLLVQDNDGTPNPSTRKSELLGYF
jgi:hypothetical protein